MFFLVVHPISLHHLKATVAWIVQRLREVNRMRWDFASPDVLNPLIIAKSLTDFNCPADAVVLVIGDPFPPFARQPGRTYVFLNFSLLYDFSRLANSAARPLADTKARQWIARKHEAMLAKASCYDVVADFLPQQTPLLQAELAEHARVIPFLTPVASGNHHRLIQPETPWDLCIVGARTERRARLYHDLAALGWRLSPETSADLASTMRACQVVLNLHAYDCPTCEYPRIIVALSLGCPLVTEQCLGLQDLIPSSCYLMGEYADLPRLIGRMMTDGEGRERLGRAGGNWIREVYAPLVDRSWNDLLGGLN